VGYDGTIYYGRLYSEVSASGPMQDWELLKSVDNGLTFTEIIGSTLSGSVKLTNIDILAAGNDAATFNLFYATTILDTITGIASLRVFKKPTVGSFIGIMAESYTYSTARGWESISMASDYREKNQNSAPYSFSIAAVKAGS